MEDKILQRLEEYKNSFPAKFEENARYVVQRCIRMVKDELAGLESKMCKVKHNDGGKRSDN